MSTYTVTSGGDTNTTGTLRYGINQANAVGSTITQINFNIGTSGSFQTINLTSQLPTLTANGVFINGLSQGGGGNTTQLITLNGTNAGSSSDGLLLQGSGDIVAGLIISDFDNGIEVAGPTNTIGGTSSGAGNILSDNRNDGVLIDSTASGNQILGNYIGINTSGIAQANSGNGVEIAGSDNTIGDTVSAARNFISGNTKDGVLIDSGASGNVVEGDFIGTDASGSTAVANSIGVEDAGIDNTVGSSTSGATLNIISGNKNDGVLLDSTASGTLIDYSYIGINIHSTALANGTNGVEVESVGNTIGGSVVTARDYISGNGNDGVRIDSGASGNMVEGDFIGLGTSGTNGVGNVDGVYIAGNNNTIGGTSSGYTNVISGNSGDGVWIDSGGTGNLVDGDDIGTDYTGNNTLRNSGNGIEVAGDSNTIGGSASGARNIIAGNSSDGILIDSTGNGNLVLGNYIGLNYSGAALGNGSNGIEIEGNNNTIGGTTSGSRNLISGNSNDGMLLASGGSGNLVLGNYIGTDSTGNNAVANNGNGIEIVGNGNTVGGVASTAFNVISGNTKDGVKIDAGASGSQVVSNHIGTNAAGTAALGNSIGIEDAGSGNTLGGSVSNSGNVISGNKYDGVLLDITASGETVQANYVGLNKNATAALGNGSNGIEIEGTDNNNGGNSGSNYYTRNFISGNANDGVFIGSGATGNVVQGNFIGVNITGTVGAGNAGNGVEIAGIGNTIGGTVNGVGNVISGNSKVGVVLDGTGSGNLVQGNYVGTDYTGKNALGNSGSGIEVAGDGNTVGGTTAGSSNVIAGNSGNGVQIDSLSIGNVVLGNSVGLNISGAALGNGTNGVSIDGQNNTIGGSLTGAGNSIANNNGDGVLVSVGAGNTISRNSVFANTGEGIYLASGGNNNLAAPSLSSASLSGTTLTVTGTFTASTANAGYVLEFFANPDSDGEGRIYLGSLTVTPTSTGTQDFTFTTTTTVMESDPLITATLTDPSGDTSEISTPNDGIVNALTSLNVLDMNTGETVPTTVPLNTFSTWSEDLLAQVSVATVSSYSWNVSQAPDLTNVSGASTANLQGTWTSFTGASRTDTISVTETPVNGSPFTETITFLVAGTDSPAYSSSRPTSSGTWPTVITPDQITSDQPTAAAGPYAGIGEADGSVQTSFSMPSYNPNTTPVSLDYDSTAANPRPIFLAEYQLPVGQPVPSTIKAQLTFDNTALATVTYNSSGLNPGDIVQIALQANATSLNTGRYPWSITVTDGSTPTTYSGNVDIVNEANSPYGAGWSLDNAEQLVSVSGGEMLVNPDGTSLYFANNGQGGYTTPAGDFSTLTYSNGVYTRTMPDGTKINFNSNGLQTSIVDTDGNTTTFNYNSSNLLTSITDMNGQQTTLAYNAANEVTSITDPVNRTATLSYSGKQLTSITDPGNNVWKYGYDSANDLTALTDPNNHTTTFVYNSADRVSSVTQPDSTTEKLTAMQMNGWAAAGSSNVTPTLLATGNQALFTDANDNVWTTGLDWLGFGEDTEDIDPLGDASLNYINANGLVWLSADALGRPTIDFFDSNGNVTEDVAPDDSTQQYQYNSLSEITQYTDQEGNVSQFSYNSKGDLTQFTDPLSDITTYTYNNAGLVTSTTDPNGNTTTYAYNRLNELTSTTSALGGVTTYAYDDAGDLTSTTDARGFTTTYSYNALGWMTGETLPDTPGVYSTYTYAYDKVGNLTSVTDPLNHTTSYSYNAVNELTAVTNALNETTTYGYDADGNQTSVTNPLGQATTFGYNAADELTSMTDPLGDQTQYGYDAAGEQTSIIDPMGNQTVITYTPRGEVASENVYAAGSSGEASGGGVHSLARTSTSISLMQLSYLYYPCGCPESVTTQNVRTSGGSELALVSPASGSGTGSSGETTSYQRDALHRVTSMTDAMGNTTAYSYDKDSNLTSTTDPNGNTTQYGYNAMDTLTSVTNALGQTTSYGYDSDGNLTSVTDPLNQTTSYTYDDQGRVLTETAPNGGVTKFAYDLAGNLTSVTDPDYNTTTYTYDATNELVSTTEPQAPNNPATYAYNAAGELTSTTDADGRTITYAYDAAGRETAETWVGGNYTATYQYNADSELTSTSDPYSTYTYTYNALGQETSVDNAGTPGVPTVTLDYSYDSYGNRTSMTDSLGGSVSYSYNADNDMTSLGLSVSGTLDTQVTFGYDAGSRLTGMTETAPSVSGDTLTTSYSYDKANELTNITAMDVSKSLTLANYTYGYNAGGELTSYQDNSGNSLTYGYDANGELTSATGTLAGSNYTFSYNYDVNGNRTSTSTGVNGSLTSATYSTGTGNELQNDGTYSYTYDNDGNMTSQTNLQTGSVTYYTWDYENRLIEEKIETSEGQVLEDEKFTYDVFGNRIAVSLNGTPQLYTVYDGSNPYMDFNGSGQLTERYLTNPKSLNQFYGQVNASGTTQWFMTDNLGSIRQVVSTSGSVLDAITYDPYGNILHQTIDANAPRFLYAGGAYDPITGNNQFDKRYYTPEDGRFESHDPLGFQAGDTDLYRYVFNDPTEFTDPSGELSYLVPLGLGGAALLGLAGYTGYKSYESTGTLFDKGIWGASVSGLGEGAMATLDGLIPFADPFAHYGLYDRNDPILQTSQTLGALARDLCLIACIPNITTWIRNPILYEVGSTTVPSSVFQAMEGMTAIQRGSYLLTQYGWLAPFIGLTVPGEFAITVGTGLTPGGWLAVVTALQIIDYFWDTPLE